jgi:type I restriction enzyme S subunit
MTAAAPQQNRPADGQTDALPPGWSWKTLTDLSTVVSKGTTPTSLGHTFASRGIPFLRAEDVLGGPVSPTCVTHHISPETHEALARSNLLPGDLLVTIAGTLGRVGYVPEDAPQLNCNQAVAFCRLDPHQADVRFVCHACQFGPITKALTDQKAGGGVQNLSLDQLRSLRLPIPPLPEQRRITAHLREQLSAVAEARAAVQAQINAAQTLPAAHLQAVFSGSALKKWLAKPLIEVAEISGGVTLGRDLRGRPARQVPYLRVANVKDGWLDLSHVKEVEATEAEIGDCRLRFGDLLLTEGGDPDKLGRGTYWQEQLPECIHQNHIFRVRFDLSASDPAFAAAQFGSPYGKAYFLAHAKQTTGIATINRTVLSKFPFLTPPFAEQRAIAARLEADQTEAASLTSALAEKLTTLDHLPAALLREAFAGRM